MIDLEFKESLKNLLNYYGADSYCSISADTLAIFLIRQIEGLVELEKIQENYNEEDSFDDSMDGDHDSALASAGHGTDEDYGSASETL